MPSRLPKEDSDNTAQKAEKVVEEVEANIYWAPAKSYHLANFKNEKQLESGKVIQREVSLKFTNHIFRTSDPAEIEYIENCDAFDKTENTGQIKKCKDMAMAQELTQGVAVIRSVKTVEASESSAVNY